MKPPSLPSRVGRYEIVDRLGAGGMGVVYLATDPLLRRTVAIKVLPGQDEDLRERFGREARSAAALRHNNVVTIYDVGEDAGQPFLAMEFLDGETMAELIQRKAPLTVERRLQLIIELCAGLGHAHKSAIVHRDVKPGNLMITTDGVLKILDFGLARLTTATTQAGLTRAGTVMGTPHYMSPEQVEGAPVDHRSDIFSVGLVLYELLSYKRAYPGDSAHVVLHNIVHKTPTPIRIHVPTLDPALEEIVHKGLEKVVTKRYQALATLSADLERVRERLLDALGDSTVVAPRAADAKMETPQEREPPRSPMPRVLRNLDAVAQRRTAQVESHVKAAAKHFDDGDYEAAIVECENAIVFDPKESRALQLLERAHRALDDAQVGRWLQEAKALVNVGELSAAEALIERSLQLRADSGEAAALQREIREKRRDRELAAERLRAAHAAIDRAKQHFANEAYEAAVRSIIEALGYDPDNAEALSLKERFLAARDEQRRLREQRPMKAATGSAESRARPPAPQDVDREGPLPDALAPEPLAAAPNTPPFAPPPLPSRADGPRVWARVILAVSVIAIVGGGIWWQYGGSRSVDTIESVAPPAPTEPAPSLQTPSAQSPPPAVPPPVVDSKPTGTQPDATTPSGTTRDQRVGAESKGDARKTVTPTPPVPVPAPPAPRSFAGSLAEAKRLFDDGEYVRATALYRKILEAEPGNAEATIGLESVVRAQEAERKALDRRAPALTNEQQREIANLLTDAEQRQSEGEYDAAIKGFEAVLRLDPKNARATSGLAATRKAQSAEAEALKKLRKPGQ